jgi:signal transduction histidine kinase
MAVLPGILRAAALLLATRATFAAEPIRFSAAEATFHRGDEAEFLKVIDGVPEGPLGWSPAPNVTEPHALVVRCERPVEADELDIDLFFLAGRPWNALAEFSLSFTTDTEPSLQGNWQPLEITRYAAEVGTLRRTGGGGLHLDFFSFNQVGNQPDDGYHLTARLPGGTATGFRLDAVPVQLPGTEARGLSWWPPYDFTLTEFRVGVHVRQTTNIALHQPVTESHELYGQPWVGQKQQASNLTDGLPATIAHPDDPTLGPAFYFEVDLGRVAELDHFNLRNRGDEAFDRMSRLRLKWFEQAPALGASPTWEAFHRADGSHPAPGGVEVLRAGDGKGAFRGRYLRISSESPVPLSPQLAEVEVYETRMPVLVAVRADDQLLESRGMLEVPPGTRRLQLELAIPQSGRPPGEILRWRMPGEVDDWQPSSRTILDLACPSAGEHVFEAQALHSDQQWDATVFRLPLVVRQHFWRNQIFLAIGFVAAIATAVILSRRAIQRRTARQVATANARAALAEERARIARDLHDDLGANLAEIAMISELARESLPPYHPARGPLEKIYDRAEGNARRLGEIVWAVNPANDTLEHFTKYLCKSAQDYLASAHIRCRFKLPDAMPAGGFTATQRYHLLLAAKEAVHNAARHGRPGTVTLELGVRHGRFVVEIHDDGQGCDATAAAASPRGCGNMRLRMQAVGGSFRITSAPNGGTTVVLAVPFSS